MLMKTGICRHILHKLATFKIYKTRLAILQLFYIFRQTDRQKDGRSYEDVNATKVTYLLYRMYLLF